MKKILLALLIFPATGHAADERARFDFNRFASELGVSETTGELRRLKSTNDGFLIVVSTAAPGSSGAATEATLSSIDGKTPSLGQAVSANSVPVVIASDQSSVSVTGSSVSIQNVAGTTITVDALDLDIRDLSSVQDSVSAVITNTSVSVDDGGGSLTVDSTDLDIRDLNSASDSISAVITNASLAVNDGGTPLDVSQETFSTITISSHSISTSTAQQILPSNSSRKSHLVCNESEDIVRTGPSSITTSVGTPIQPTVCLSFDAPSTFTGSLFAISSGTSPAKVSTQEGT